ncbi:MAG: GNAT family N-acetyltransferase [Phycisphaerales bacterium]|nr:GNAT family N-acetyltransferase [Phycisphaerales bacterium]
MNSSSEFHLALMAVDKTVRGKGLGSAIVRDYLALAELRSADSVWLHVEPLNTRAQSLYKKHGFMIVGRDGNSLLMIRGTGGAGKSCAEQEL